MHITVWIDEHTSYILHCVSNRIELFYVSSEVGKSTRPIDLDLYTCMPNTI